MRDLIVIAGLFIGLALGPWPALCVVVLVLIFGFIARKAGVR